MIRKYTYYIVIAGLILVVFGAVVLFLWANFPTKAYVITNEPVPVVPSSLKGGGYIVVQAKYCREAGFYDVKRKLISDKISIDLPEETGKVGEKGCGQEDLPVLLPKVSNTGVYHIEYDTMVQVNPIRNVPGKFVTQDFTLTN